MHRKLLRLALSVLHMLFWAATLFVLVCFFGSFRWLRPGMNPSASDLLPLGATLLAALGLFTIFYVYDTIWGEEADPPKGRPRP